MIVQWVRTKIEDVAEINPRLPKGKLTGEISVSFVPMAAVGAADGSIDVSETRPYAAVQKGYTAFMEGDVLFAKITPCMENGEMAIVPPVSNGHGFGSTEFHVLRSSAAIDARYLYYFVSGKGLCQDAEHNMTGAVGQRRTDAILRVQNLDRYDDRDDIRTNLIESYDRLMAFVAKHVADDKGQFMTNNTASISSKVWSFCTTQARQTGR